MNGQTDKMNLKVSAYCTEKNNFFSHSSLKTAQKILLFLIGGKNVRLELNFINNTETKEKKGVEGNGQLRDNAVLLRNHGYKKT